MKVNKSGKMKPAVIFLPRGETGTLLYAINNYKHLKKPFFGLAGGTVNFLMNDKPIQPKYTTKSFSLIKAKIYYEQDGKEYMVEHEAFNDICVGGDMNSWIDFLVNEKDEFFGEFKGGGLIISTPQGSTGINKNNNGSVLPLGADLWSITGDKTNRKIDYVIKPRKTEIFLNSRTTINVWVDGSNYIVKNVFKVELSKGSFVKVIFNDYSEFKRKRRV